MHAVLERGDLLADRRAAVQRLDDHAAVLADLRQLASDLQRELARRAQDENLWLAVRGDQVVDRRQTERRGLAGAGARLDQQVLALADRLEHGRLHGRREEVAHVVERLLDVGMHAELVPARRSRLGGNLWSGISDDGLEGPGDYFFDGLSSRDGRAQRGVHRASTLIVRRRIVRHRAKPWSVKTGRVLLVDTPVGDHHGGDSQGEDDVVLRCSTRRRQCKALREDVVPRSRSPCSLKS